MKFDKLNMSTSIDISEVCNGVFHPIMKETLTNNKKVINCPHLCDVWIKIMCKEFVNIVEGYSDGGK